jgi:hypothetical protein
VNKKKQKNFIYAGPEVVSATTPMAQHKRKFLRRFFQKAAAFLCCTASNQAAHMPGLHWM